MDFRRKKKRGQSQKSRRTWFSEEGYRIVWRREVCGVQVAARFQACVRVLVPYSDGQLRPVWDFVNRNRRLIKTLKAAEDECERHKQLWERACQATGIRALKELFGGKRPLGLPLWVRKKLDRRLYAILIDNRPMIKNRDEEEAQSCTESLPQASDAPGPGGPTKTSDSFCLAYGSSFGNPYPCLACRGQGTIYARSKAASTVEPSVAPPAEAAAKGRNKPAAKRTVRCSKPTAKRKPSMTGSPDSDAKPSRGSRKKNCAPCGS